MFISRHGGEAEFVGLRTTDVCERFLKPSTCQEQKSYCPTFKNDPVLGKEISGATAFVSHAWGHEFLDVVAALEAYDAAQAVRTVFWFDIFSNNQHKASVRDFFWWQTVFKNNIGRLRLTLLVLEWEDPKPLNRAWCLWEIFSTVHTRSHFRVLMSPRNETTFAKVLVDDFDKLVFKTCTVDVSNAQSFLPGDRVNIFRAVEATIGFEEVNKQVIAIMREWMAQCGHEALGKMRESDRPVSSLQSNLGRLLQDQGKFQESESLLREAMEACRRSLDDSHPQYLAGLGNLGRILQLQGKLVEAEPLLRGSLEGRRKILGDTHPDTLKNLNHLGVLLQKQGKPAEAEPFLREALESLCRTLGGMHSETLSSMSHLGLVLRDQGKLADAEVFFTEALQGRRQTLGKTHPHTLISIYNLGTIFQRRGRLSEAEPLFREELQASRRTLGDTHPDTLISIHNLGTLTQAQGNLEEAGALLSEVLRGRRLVLGNNIADTIRSMNAYGLNLKSRGQRGEAGALLQEAVQCAAKAFPPNHPQRVQFEKDLEDFHSWRNFLREFFWSFFAAHYTSSFILKLYILVGILTLLVWAWFYF